MRNYYYCKANEMVYTENEMKKSEIPSARFTFLGTFKNRLDAENYYDNNHLYYCEHFGKRI